MAEEKKEISNFQTQSETVHLNIAIKPTIPEGEKAIYTNSLIVTHSDTGEFLLLFHTVHQWQILAQQPGTIQEGTLINVPVDGALLITADKFPVMINSMLVNYYHYLNTFKDDSSLSEKEKAFMAIVTNEEVNASQQAGEDSEEDK